MSAVPQALQLQGRPTKLRLLLLRPPIPTSLSFSLQSLPPSPLFNTVLPSSQLPHLVDLVPSSSSVSCPTHGPLEVLQSLFFNNLAKEAYLFVVYTFLDLFIYMGSFIFLFVCLVGLISSISGLPFWCNLSPGRFLHFQCSCFFFFSCFLLLLIFSFEKMAYLCFFLLALAHNLAIITSFSAHVLREEHIQLNNFVILQVGIFLFINIPSSTSSTQAQVKELRVVSEGTSEAASMIQLNFCCQCKKEK